MQEKVKEIVKKSLEELNEQLDETLEYDDDLRLIGKEAVLDSMSFVTLMTIIEQKTALFEQ